MNFVAIDTEFVACTRVDGGLIEHPRPRVRRADARDKRYKEDGGRRRTLRRIVQVGATKMDMSGNELDSFVAYIKLDDAYTFDESARDAQVARITRATLEAEGISWTDAYIRLEELIDENTECVVAHGYKAAELDVLEIECFLDGFEWPYGANSSQWRCTLDMWKRLSPGESRGRGASTVDSIYRRLLGDEAQTHREGDVHDALGDARMCGAIYVKLRALEQERAFEEALMNMPLTR